MKNKIAEVVDKVTSLFSKTQEEKITSTEETPSKNEKKEIVEIYSKIKENQTNIEDLSEDQISKILGLVQEEIKVETKKLNENVLKLNQIRHHNKELEKQKTFEVYEMVKNEDIDLEQLSKEELIRIKVLLTEELKLYTEKNIIEEKNNKILVQKVERMSKKAKIS